ncbi:hypothetical protein NEDG_01719 [Nematocida displodere]|uniref:RING-type domain-containing protein n=1 Tax=Nematocida displodere TaxID=1805483 RepID=A0A177EEJ6_9MICR|nr:hypothetical protein NEDG_01719 [Nematocida displodere]
MKRESLSRGEKKGKATSQWAALLGLIWALGVLCGGEASSEMAEAGSLPHGRLSLEQADNLPRSAAIDADRKVDAIAYKLNQLQRLVQVFSDATPGLELVLQNQSAQVIESVLKIVSCFRIDLDRYTPDNQKYDFMRLPLQKIHVTKSGEYSSSEADGHKLVQIINSFRNLDIETFEISNLDQPITYPAIKIPRHCKMFIQKVVFDKVSSGVIDLFLTKFGFFNGTELFIENSSIENLQCLNNLYITHYPNRPVATGLSLINLPRITDFHSECFDNIDVIKYIVFRNLGSGVFHMIDSNLTGFVCFLVSTFIKSFTLPMCIFNILWNSQDIEGFPIFAIATIIIEDMENEKIDSPLQYYESSAFYNTFTATVVLNFRPTARLTATDLDYLLTWVGLGFICIRKVVINAPNWEALQASAQAKSQWSFSMPLLEELRIGEKQAKLTYAWKEPAEAHTLPELTENTRNPENPENPNTIYFIPLAKYTDWVSGKMFADLTPTAAKLLPKNRQERDPTFRCPVCLCTEQDLRLENKAPGVDLLACGHMLCFECLSTMVGLEPCPGGTASLCTMVCPLCRMDVTPSIFAGAIQKPEERIRVVNIPINKYMLTNCLVKKYLAVEFEGCLAQLLKEKELLPISLSTRLTGAAPF